MVLVSLMATYDMALSAPKIVGVLYGIGIYYAVVRACREAGAWKYGFLLFIGLGTGIATLSLLLSHWGNKIPIIAAFTAVFPRLAPALPGAEAGLNPNEVAGVLLWVIPPVFTSVALLVFFVLRRKPARLPATAEAKLSEDGSRPFGPSYVGQFGEDYYPRRWYRNGLSIWSILIGGSLLALYLFGAFILTQSRTAYVSLALIVPLLMFMLLSPKLRIGFGLGGAALVGLALLAFFINTDELLRFRIWAGFVASIQSRLEIWSRGIYALQDFAFTGMGMNTFRQLVRSLYPLLLVAPDIDIGHAHNEFLQAGLDLGIPGLIAFASLQFGALWMIVRTGQQVQVMARQKPRDSGVSLPNRLIVLGLGAGLLGHLVFGMMDAVALGAKPGFMFWILLGLISSLYIQVDRAIGLIKQKDP